MQLLDKFFAVTASERSSSIYEVGIVRGKGTFPYARKMVLRGASKIPVGRVLERGTLLAVCDRLIMFRPQVISGGVFKRQIEEVDTDHWGDQSSDIIALFPSMDTAECCFAEIKTTLGTPCDSRWREGTMKIHEEIGDFHPQFVICRKPPLGLGTTKT